MELLVMAYALKTSCANNIIGVIPYFPYSKQCKMRKRGSVVCKLLASMLAKAGMDCGFYFLLCSLNVSPPEESTVSTLRNLRTRKGFGPDDSGPVCFYL